MKSPSLDPQKVTKLALKLHAHLAQFAYEPVSTRRAFQIVL